MTTANEPGQQRDRPARGSRGPRRVLIAGHGTAGTSLADDVRTAGDLVLGFLDDVSGSDEVLGRLDEVAEVCARIDAQVVYFAIPSAEGDVVRDFVAHMPSGVELAIIPRTYRVVSRERVSVDDLTDVDVLDFVGRAPVKHDMMSARSLIAGKRVLVTGAAGSIGSRLATQIHLLDPQLVVCVDRSESGIFHLGRSLQDIPNFVLEIGDIQSEPRIAQLMERHRPDIVFHVAAYKHVPLMQDNAVEAFNNNVWGTMNVLTQAARHGVGRVVYVSTDKAVNPTNVMGSTKRIGELLLHDVGEAEGASTVYSAVRFGNVLESEGSVMQTFRKQLAAGKNLTVTDPGITRYFMTIDEAAQLVIQTATSGRHGDLFVLDMGEPIRVFDLAQGLIDAVNPSLSVDIVGLRPGEKMYEELSYRASAVDATTHPKIFVVTEDDDHERGDTLRWAKRLLERTRTYSITDDELRDELRAFGFTSLQ
ncbi:SDR family NAD(P)-dependent oxidoreductase [Naasia lichenicola]|uniref:Polysaccharide biosynthesis protein n=1 Tax=Naasia lichenicola TaxID=2565933 RepID=A0A4S4FNH9_9MICO|nr:SDR family NAD(P)-dependent oxidoreductase [Naasia lichenicola]THG30826.1 polysaccharide biosynthesis protein [Naasia lichenicola]